MTEARAIDHQPAATSSYNNHKSAERDSLSNIEKSRHSLHFTARSVSYIRKDNVIEVVVIHVKPLMEIHFRTDDDDDDDGR